MKTRKKVTSVLSSISLTLLAAFFFLYSHSEAQDTSNWKTYTNKEFGYELKYPPDLTIKYLDSISRDSVLFVRNSRVCLKILIAPIVTNGSVMYKNEWRSQKTFSLKDHIVSGMWAFCSDIRDGKISHERVIELIKWKPITIDGFDGIQADSSENKCINKRLPISIFIIGNTRHWFGVFDGSASEYNKILSTFKFIK